MDTTLSERLRTEASGFGGDADPSWGPTAALLNEAATVVDRALEVVAAIGNGPAGAELTSNEMAALIILEDQLRNGVRILPTKEPT